MAHWLIKSEPGKWSWQDQVKAGEKGTFWNGVRNHSAKLNLMAMRVGEQAFFYHSNEGKEIVGIVEIINPIIQIRRIRAASSEWLMFARSRHLKNRWASMP